MSQPTVLILGATSSIARALAQQLAQQGQALHLAGRSTVEVERVAQDLAIRYQVPVSWSAFEATAYASHPDFWAQVLAQTGSIVGVILSLGELGEQAQAQREGSYARQIIDSNYTGIVSILTLIANYFEAQGRGYIIGISSVAGDRGRQSNYVYGSAKGALSVFLQGLRHRLAAAGIQVLTVKPGFVDTKMTFGKPGLFLVATPEQVAVAILRARDRRQTVVYVPWFWFWIMLIIRAIPEPIFKHLKL